MSPASARANSTAPEFDGILRNRLENMPVKVLAAETGIDESHLGKFIKGNAALKIDDVGKLMRLAELKAVDVKRTCIDTGLHGFFRRLYARCEAHAPWLISEDEV